MAQYLIKTTTGEHPIHLDFLGQHLMYLVERGEVVLSVSELPAPEPMYELDDPLHWMNDPASWD